MDNQLTELERELLEKIISTCEKDPQIIEEMNSESYLIGPESPLGLDSLDAVEIVSLVQLDYGVRIASQETSRDILQSIGSLVKYIELNR